MRGNEISMIFQEPMTSLNPVFTIGDAADGSDLSHEDVSKTEAFDRAVEMLELVGIPDAASAHERLSAPVFRRQRQRVMIAMALACNPSLADCRRTDDGSGRDDPGADSGTHAEDQGCSGRTRRSC